MKIKTIKSSTMMNKITSLAFLLCLLSLTASAQDEALEKALFQDYEVRIEKNPDTQSAGILKIFKSGTLAYEEEGNAYTLTGDGDFPKAGDDITGDQVPDLAISHFSGGAHCCYDLLIFSLGEQLILIQRIEGAHAPVTFKDVNADAIPELIVADSSFAYWHASFASSPVPEVILSFKDGNYVPDPELMKKPLEEIALPVPNDEIHQAECAAGNAWIQDDYCLTSEVWGHMLELIYAGHPGEAWVYLDSVWGSDEAGKTAFLKEFKQQLRKSSYPVLPPEER